MLKGFPKTGVKIRIAKMLYKIVAPFVGGQLLVKERKGVKYELDLTEGIDLSLFLFGNFQKHITGSKLLNIPVDAIVIDIGGNFGVMALQYANMVPKGEVISFEPTPYAISRFKRNLNLNPDKKDRITIVNAFVSSKTSYDPKIKAYSSWKIDGKHYQKEHPVHHGIQKPAPGTASITLDEFCRKRKLARIDLIKVDTDGHEFEVFKGATDCIVKYRPQIIFEVGKYVMKEQNIVFSCYLEYFHKLHYTLYDSKTRKKVTETNHERLIPSLGTIDIIALPNG